VEAACIDLGAMSGGVLREACGGMTETAWYSAKMFCKVLRKSMFNNVAL
jgi:hypothetical protein